MKKTVLVTGANGFVGTYLLKILSDYDVIALTKNGELENSQNITYHSSDITDAEQIEKIILKYCPDLIFHLAGIAPTWIKDLKLLFDVNVLGTANIYQAVIKTRERNSDYNPKILYVSSSDVYGNSQKPITEDFPLLPLNLYASSKVAADRLSYQYSQTHRLNIVIARPFPHIGPGQSNGFFIPDMLVQLKKIKDGEQTELKVGNLDSIRDYTDVRDVVRAYLLLIESNFDPGEVYNICSSNEVKMADLLQLLLSKFPQTIRIKKDPDRLRTIEASIRIGSNVKLHQKTGWRASIDLDKTLDDCITQILP